MTAFVKEEHDLYSAFFKLYKTMYRIIKCVKSTTPVIKVAVIEKLEFFLESITENNWTEDGWRVYTASH